MIPLLLSTYLLCGAAMMVGIRPHAPALLADLLRIRRELARRGVRVVPMDHDPRRAVAALVLGWPLVVPFVWLQAYGLHQLFGEPAPAGTGIVREIERRFARRRYARDVRRRWRTRIALRDAQRLLLAAHTDYHRARCETCDSARAMDAR